ncbi:hypothetical protein EKO23_21660 [Nocardioides guangzhouensis]|uniref:Uncharacterized protein n=1 Tax=Nocardioides guangzhouensis TaxID=2497878 RepID=A0A4Q4Z6B4_9ACTN|nr:hypothetical protein [Nocardioides guangzhouensis]RYP82484.1 hypothetical protein EKO23_21660 [Nocardioides guangzhouensis]
MTPRWTPGQWALRAVMALAPLLAVVASVPAGASLRGWFLVLLVVLGAVYALFPASLAGIGVLALPLAWWVAVPDDPLHPMSMVAAAALLVAHVAGLVAGLGPDRLPVDPALLWRWVGRSALVLSAAPVVWLVADAMAEQPEQPWIWVAGVGAAALGAVVAGMRFGTSPAGSDALAKARLDVTNG